MSGFGSKALFWCAGPDLRLGGTALSDRASTKSFTIKSRCEKVSRVKTGACGNTDLAEYVEGGWELEEIWLEVAGILP